MNTFSKPLSPEDEKYYLTQLGLGNVEARNILVEHNLRLVTHIIKKYSLPGKELDDLISIGTIGLIKAVNTYNPQKGNRLAAYAAKCIENELLMMMRWDRKVQREVSMYEPIGTDKEGNAISLLDVICCEDRDVVEEYAQTMKIGWLRDSVERVLEDREKRILILRYGIGTDEPMTQREVAALLQISRSYVSRIEKRALEKLRDDFQKDETYNDM